MWKLSLLFLCFWSSTHMRTFAMSSSFVSSGQFALLSMQDDDSSDESDENASAREIKNERTGESSSISPFLDAVHANDYLGVNQWLVKWSRKMLLEKDAMHHTALEIAAKNGFTDVFLSLLLIYTRRDHKFYQSIFNSAFIQAYQNGHLKIVDLIISDVDDETCSTALLSAITQEQVDFVAFLLEDKPVLLNRKDSNKQTPLMLAVQLQKATMVDMLLRQEGVDVNAVNVHGDSALMLAVKQGQVAIVTALLNHPMIQFDALDSHGKNILMNAMEPACQPKMLASILTFTESKLKTRAGIAKFLNHHIENILSPAIFLAMENCPISSFEKMLHNVKLKIHLPNTEGANVLIRAVQLGRADLVTAILFLFGKNALVVNFKDGVGKTALHYAVERSSITELEALMKSKQTIDFYALATMQNDWTPLHAACANGRAAHADMLLYYGRFSNDAKDLRRPPLLDGFDKFDKLGRSPLWYAVFAKSTPTVLVLLKYFGTNADILNKMNSDGNTAFSLALDPSRGHAPIALALMKTPLVKVYDYCSPYRNPWWNLVAGKETPMKTELLFHLIQHPQTKKRYLIETHKGEHAIGVMSARGRLDLLQQVFDKFPSSDWQDFMIPNKNGLSPFHLAVIHEQTEVVHFFLHRVGSVYPDALKTNDYHGRSAFIWAASMKNSKSTEILRALHAFATKDNNFLLLRDENGKNAFDYMKSNGMDKIFQPRPNPNPKPALPIVTVKRLGHDGRWKV